MTVRQHLRSLLVAGALLGAVDAQAFCGFYVARADKALYNQSSEVVLVRDGDRTVLTMNSDFQGEVDDFAMVIPVPTLLEREQIHVGDSAIIEHLDAYTAPRLVEYFDQDPCTVVRRLEQAVDFDLAAAPASANKAQRATALGVKIEAEYTVGEYDITILSASQSDGLITWLTASGYRIPAGAEPTVRSYLRQGMKFFVARVNLQQHDKLGFTRLRPLQVAYESAKFMLPIRLGMVNANGAQEMFVYALTRTGRVETRNYRTVRMPSGDELPESVKDDFGNFYRALFDTQVAATGKQAVLLEYAWDMNWCDPCAADPLSERELRALGVFWLGRAAPGTSPAPARIAPGPARDVFVTRLHVRYDQAHFPQDLMFIETGDRDNFQGRYVIRHPWRGESSCPAAVEYRRQLPQRLEREAQTLANLTGWSIETVRERIDFPSVPPVDDTPKPWWQRLWDES